MFTCGGFYESGSNCSSCQNMWSITSRMWQERSMRSDKRGLHQHPAPLLWVGMRLTTSTTDKLWLIWCSLNICCQHIWLFAAVFFHKDVRSREGRMLFVASNSEKIVSDGGSLHHETIYHSWMTKNNGSPSLTGCVLSWGDLLKLYISLCVVQVRKVNLCRISSTVAQLRIEQTFEFW